MRAVLLLAAALLVVGRPCLSAPPAAILPAQEAADETGSSMYGDVPPIPFPSEAVRSLVDIPNLRIHSFPGGAILQGQLLTPEDLRRATLVTASMEGVVNLCTLHPDALALAAERLTRRIRDLGIGGLDLIPAGTSLLLTGTPWREEDVPRVRQVCSAFGVPLVDGSQAPASDGRMVLFEVSFTEVNRDSFAALGIVWPAAASFGVEAGARVGRIALSAPLEVAVNALAQDGKARILSRPRILCRSGESASFQAGGEVPIPATDKDGKVSVAWKPYGIMLQVSLRMDREGRILARVASEVSTVDNSNAVQGIPGILTRRIDTSLSLLPGDAVVLSGLVNSEDAQRVRKVPLLGDIPVLGEIFRSRSFQKRETELVVFLTPKAVDAADTGTLPPDLFPGGTPVRATKKNVLPESAEPAPISKGEGR